MQAYSLLALQGFQVVVLLLHDWVPVPPLTDVRAARKGHSVQAMILGTALSSVFPVIGLVLTLVSTTSGWPKWLPAYLLATYGLLFAGELQAWWIPYLLRPEPKRAAQYEEMYGKTHAFLPVRNGIRVNTLHFALHAATLATLVTVLSGFIHRT